MSSTNSQSPTQRRRGAESAEKFTALFRMEVATSDANGVNVKCTAEIPFIPVPGMNLVVLPGDDFRKVEEVYWSEARGLEVFFEFQEEQKLKPLLQVGWQRDD